MVHLDLHSFDRFVAAFSSLNVMADTSNMPLPLRYVTNQNFVLKSAQQALFKATIGCDSLKDATLSVCAELPKNWHWHDFGGFVYMNIFNSTTTNDVCIDLRVVPVLILM